MGTRQLWQLPVFIGSICFLTLLYSREKLIHVHMDDLHKLILYLFRFGVNYSVVVADGLAPFVGKRNGQLLFQVIQHQYRQTAALYLLRIGVKDFLFKMEALVAELGGTGADGNPVRAFYLGKELNFYLHYENSIPIPVKAFANSGNIIRLTRVVELKIYGIVHVPELVNVVETYLQRHHIVKA